MDACIPGYHTNQSLFYLPSTLRRFAYRLPSCNTHFTKTVFLVDLCWVSGIAYHGCIRFKKHQRYML